jgi:heptosyltransferase-2
MDAQPMENPPSKRGGVKRLVIAPNWLGDCVMAIPFLRSLRRSDPEGRLDVLARPGGAAVFRLQGSADEVRGLPRSGPVGEVRVVRELRARSYDEAWILPNSFHAALIAWASGARRRIGYRGDHRDFLLSTSIARPLPVEMQVHDYDRLLESQSIEPDRDPPRIDVPEIRRTEARKSLALHRLDSAARPVFLAPGAAFGPTKRWPAERFALLADELMDGGVPVAIAIGPAEVELGRLIARRARHRVPVLGADDDAAGLAALFSLGRALVGNDSGPAHLAAAVGVPVVVLFGPTDPGRTAPSGAPVRVLDRFIFCSPCFRKICPYAHECLEQVPVAEVAAAVRGISEA